MLRERRRIAVAEGRSAASPVFPDTLGDPRDPSNTGRALREARGSAGFAWVTSHVFRKTAATILDEAGLSARVIADQLGHSKPSMTQDNYMGRSAVTPATAAAMESML
jgi:integrase